MPRNIKDEDAEEIARRVVGKMARSAVREEILPNAIYTTNDAAVLSGMHPVTLRIKLRAGIIQGKRRGGGVWRIKGSELLKLA